MGLEQCCLRRKVEKKAPFVSKLSINWFCEVIRWGEGPCNAIWLKTEQHDFNHMNVTGAIFTVRDSKEQEQYKFETPQKLVFGYLETREEFLIEKNTGQDLVSMRKNVA